MKKIMLFIAALMLLTINVEAGLRELIQQNVQDAEKSYDRTVSPIETQSTTFRLWIHVPTEKQRRVGEEILEKFADTDSDGKGIENNPIQIIDNGPPDTQLRYFKKEDAPQAAELLSKLKKFIPNISLKDFSGQYSNIRWIKPGHLELWLSPRLLHIELRPRQGGPPMGPPDRNPERYPGPFMPPPMHHDNHHDKHPDRSPGRGPGRN
jgi:hypothetical protein